MEKNYTIVCLKTLDNGRMRLTLRMSSFSFYYRNCDETFARNCVGFWVLRDCVIIGLFKGSLCP